jgi:hypothetical protein
MISERRLGQIIKGKNHDATLRAMKRDGNKSECWGIYDGVLVIYDEADPPAWLATVMERADENGETPDYRGQAA